MSKILIFAVLSLFMMAYGSSASAQQQTYPPQVQGDGAPSVGPGSGSEPGLTMRAATRRVCRRGSQVGGEFFGFVVFCRKCANYELRTFCRNPSDPSTCRTEWVQVGETEAECAAVPSWVVAK